MKPLVLLSVAACFLASGCDDSKNPLSDPQTSKADGRLVGIWRTQVNDDCETYYHVGHADAGANFAPGVMRIVAVTHCKGMVGYAEENFAFATAIAGRNYLNFVMLDKEAVERLDKNGGKLADSVDGYKLLRYQIDGDKLVIWQMNEGAVKEAIKGGKVKGITVDDPEKSAKFTDATENVARFVVAAGDSLWNTKNPTRFERVKAPKNAAPKASHP